MEIPGFVEVREIRFRGRSNFVEISERSYAAGWDVSNISELPHSSKRSLSGPPSESYAGRTTEMVVPLWSPEVEEWRRTEAPRLAISCLLVHRPRPFPTAPLVVKKGSKSCFLEAGAMPLPLSATVMRMRGGPPLRAGDTEARILILPFSSSASRLLATKFDRTWRSSPKTPFTCSCSWHWVSTRIFLELILVCSRKITESSRA